MVLDLGAAIPKLREWAGSTPLVLRVTIFGSYAKNTAREESDLDIAVNVETAHGDQDADTTFICNCDGWTKELVRLLGFPRVALSPEWDVREYLKEAGTVVYERPVEEPDFSGLIVWEE